MSPIRGPCAAPTSCPRRGSAGVPRGPGRAPRGAGRRAQDRQGCQRNLRADTRDRQELREHVAFIRGFETVQRHRVFAHDHRREHSHLLITRGTLREGGRHVHAEADAPHHDVDVVEADARDCAAQNGDHCVPFVHGSPAHAGEHMYDSSRACASDRRHPFGVARPGPRPTPFGRASWIRARSGDPRSTLRPTSPQEHRASLSPATHA